MSAKRYFWTVVISGIAVSAIYPVLVVMGQLILTLMGVPEARILLIYLVVLLPLLPFVFAAIVGVVSLGRLRETGGSGWWALAAVGVAMMSMSGGVIFSTIFRLPQTLLSGNAQPLMILVLNLAFPITVIAFIGLYVQPLTLEPRERLATIAATAALVWLAPNALLQAVPFMWGYAAIGGAGPFLGLYAWSALAAELIAVIALLSLLFIQRRSNYRAAA